ncbi:hypothetical protein BU645_09935 [Staphylococcus chromogenes]|uniref:hypothetical protein n=1 Tax=Staphylococcus chromogenes TaxID=46126 RepID=UPI000D1ACA83|nr:hypothetical protein [Staphylococcus chromogenes]PTG88747.1 hypothetical protein BU645_09935 [Staphylococcus chromogenes]
MKMVEEKFIIEVNEGIYLRIVDFSSGICDFTDNPNDATSFDSPVSPAKANAKDYAEKCGGKIKRFTATYEVE